MKLQIAALFVAFVGSAASASILTIDDFTSELPTRSYITGYSGNIINSVDSFGQLDVGMRYRPIPGHDSVGQTLPSATTQVFDSATQSGLSGVVGGNRVAMIEAIGVASGRSELYIGQGLLGHSNGAGLVDSRVTLTYGDAAPLNLNLTSFANGEFKLDGWSLDHTTMGLAITLTSGLVSETVSRSLPAVPYPATLDLSVPFADFSTINFADVDRISFKFTNLAHSQDSALIGGIYVVPTPGATALFGLGAFVGFRRRR